MHLRPLPCALLLCFAGFGCASPSAGGSCDELAAHFDDCGFSANRAACEARPERAEVLLAASCGELSALAGSADGDAAEFFGGSDIRSVLVLVGYDDFEMGYGLREAQELADDSGLPADAVTVMPLGGWGGFIEQFSPQVPEDQRWDMVVMISHGGYDGPVLPGDLVAEYIADVPGCAPGTSLDMRARQPYASYGSVDGSDSPLYCSTYGYGGCAPSDEDRQAYGDSCAVAIYQQLDRLVGIASQRFNAQLRNLSRRIIYFNACNTGTEPDDFLAEVSRQTSLTVFGPSGRTAGYLAPARARAILDGRVVRGLESQAVCQE